MRGQEIGQDIFCLAVPYMDVFTSVFLIRTPRGALLFDAASYESDIHGIVLPWLREMNVTDEELKYVFLSHAHEDHAGGLAALLAAFPDLCAVSQSEKLREKCGEGRFLLPREHEILLDCLRVIPIPGHTADSAAVLDTRTNTLISGDCLQMHGLFGAGKWGAAIPHPAAHRAALARLREMEIQTVVTAHDYHPLGQIHRGAQAIGALLAACLAPLDRIERLIVEHPEMNDEEICALYNSAPGTPTLGVQVVRGVRRDMARS
ncbi:MAG: MBL fold metallo-hydrolase [Clostridia bacterium]|nr:MBL fold metallo-hydrolase [Clostridia bacterium]